MSHVGPSSVSLAGISSRWATAADVLTASSMMVSRRQMRRNIPVALPGDRAFVETTGVYALSVPGRIGRPSRILDLADVAPGVGLRAVEVGEAVLPGELAARQRLAAPAADVRVRGEVRDRATDVAW